MKRKRHGRLARASSDFEHPRGYSSRNERSSTVTPWRSRPLPPDRRGAGTAGLCGRWAADGV